MIALETILDCAWNLPPANLSLPDDEVHLWCVSLDQPDTSMELLAKTLAPDEQSRADRFYFERDRRHYIVGRGVLRTILGRYLNLEPRRLDFCYGARGKPYLPASLNPGQICFNLAHSGGLALYALTRGREIGVDIEHIRFIAEIEQIAERFFSAQENAVLRTLLPSQQQEAFFNCWTRKEAYIKATGDGLSQPLDQFDVSLAPEEPAKLLSVAGQIQTRWSMLAVRTVPGYVAALVVEGQDWSTQYWQWSE